METNEVTGEENRISTADLAMVHVEDLFETMFDLGAIKKLKKGQEFTFSFRTDGYGVQLLFRKLRKKRVLKPGESAPPKKKKKKKAYADAGKVIVKKTKKQTKKTRKSRARSLALDQLEFGKYTASTKTFADMPKTTIRVLDGGVIRLYVSIDAFVRNLDVRKTKMSLKNSSYHNQVGTKARQARAEGWREPQSNSKENR
jgi:hypothetical protein